MDLGSNKQIKKSFSDILFSYLFSHGYLTISDENKYKLPNKEIKCEFLKKIAYHYKNLYEIDYIIF